MPKQFTVVKYLLRSQKNGMTTDFLITEYVANIERQYRMKLLDATITNMQISGFTRLDGLLGYKVTDGVATSAALFNIEREFFYHNSGLLFLSSS